MSKVVCAWCAAVIRDGLEPVSHSICQPCAATAAHQRPAVHEPTAWRLLARLSRALASCAAFISVLGR